MSHLPNIEEFQTTADIFKQLSDPTRIRIFISELQKGNRC